MIIKVLFIDILCFILNCNTVVACWVFGGLSLKAEIVEKTLEYPKKHWIIVVSRLFYFLILMSFLVVSLNNCPFSKRLSFLGADFHEG